MDAASGTRVRVVLGTASGDGALARSLRDAGHEVVVCAADPQQLAAAAVQEDADLVVPDAEEWVGDVRRLLAERGVDDVEVVAAGEALARAAAVVA